MRAGFFFPETAMAPPLPDLSCEEWNALEALSRGGDEARRTPPLMVDLLVRLKLASRQGDGAAITYAGKQQLLRYRALNALRGR